MMWKSKADGMPNYFNKAWSEYTGLSKEESLGQGWQKAIHISDLNRFLQSWSESVKRGDSFHIECRMRRHDNQMRWHWLLIVPEYNGQDALVGWIGACTDIHERKLADKKMIEAERMAVSANIVKTHFLANMSHEIRTPLSAILGFAELMLNPHLSFEDRTHYVHTICRSGKQVLKIIDEILDISKVESGHMEIENIDVNLGILLRDLRDLLMVKARSKGIGLEVRFKSSIPEHIFSDPTRVRQILINVIGNAIKFTEKGKVTLEAEWTAATKLRPSALSFRVEDTGVGIDPLQSKKLFQPFVQGDTSTTRRFGGTGLGLALSRKIAQALGGDVFLEKSEINKGSSFRVEIETEALTNSKFIDKLDDFIMKDLELPAAEEAHALAGMKILLVEDSPINQLLISRFLTGAGAQVELAENGALGVQKALAGNYAVVLMDIQMPEMDGYEATTKLREQSYKRPIIALTAHALKEDRERCLKAGCADYLTKPIDRKMLISRIQQLTSDVDVFPPQGRLPEPPH
ncbi:MAG: response regulator [Pseudobdellovibrionaceae bacterium]